MRTNVAIRVGVLGATGYIGKPYRKEIRETDNVRIVALSARRQDLLQQEGSIDGAELITDQWTQVVDHPDVNFVVVATPDALHHEAVLRCAKAGKHVLCEKPVGKSISEAAEMLEAYRTAGSLAHFVPFWTRYAEIFQEARKIVDSGRLGSVRGVIYRWHNPRPANMPLTWRDDAKLSAGGSIADVGSHAYDTVCWLLGDRAKRVLAHAETLTGAKNDLGQINLDEALNAGTQSSAGNTKALASTPDYASIAWQFASGAVGVLVVSHAHAFRTGLCPELELHGSQASLGINRVTGDVMIANAGGKLERVANVPDRGFGNRFEKYVFPVVRAVIEGRTPPQHPSLEDGYRVQCFTDAALQSAKSGGWSEVTDA